MTEQPPSSTGDSLSQLGLERSKTANLVWLFDIGILLAVLLTFIWYQGPTLVPQTPQLYIAYAGTLVLLLRLCLMAIAAGGFGHGFDYMYGIVVDGVNWFKRLLVEHPTPLSRPDGVSERTWINSHAKYYYGLLALGILAQSMLVVGTGGMAASPFATVLIATFLLGQLRSPSQRTIGALLVVGVVTAIGTHYLFIACKDHLMGGTVVPEFRALDYVWAGLLVAAAGTIVNAVSLEDRRNAVKELEVAVQTMNSIMAKQRTRIERLKKEKRNLKALFAHQEGNRKETIQ